MPHTDTVPHRTGAPRGGRPARTGGGWQHKGRAQRRSIQKWTTCHRAPGVQQGRARAHARGLPARHRRGCRRRRVRRPADRRRPPGLRARPAGQPHLQRRGPRLDPRAGHARGPGLGLVEEAARVARSEMPDRDRNKLLTLRHLLSDGDGRPAGRSAWRSRPSTRPATPGRSSASWPGCSPSSGWTGRRRPGRPWVRVMSFSQLATQRMRQLCPEVPLVFLVEKGSPTIVRYRDGCPARGRADRRPRHRDPARHPEVVRRQHERGHEVFVWTVDEAADVDLCLRVGVDAIITNRPAGSSAPREAEFVTPPHGATTVHGRRCRRCPVRRFHRG